VLCWLRSSATALSRRQGTGFVRSCLERHVTAAHRMNRAFRQSEELLQKSCCIATANNGDAVAHIVGGKDTVAMPCFCTVERCRS
jgi:hypothetical protein